MELIEITTQRKEHDYIKDVVSMFDNKAEICLFGPGTKNKNQWVDLYIRSKKIGNELKNTIKEKISSKCSINIDLVCVLSDKDSWENTEAVSLKL